MVKALPQTLPLLFSFKQVVVGNGFVAGVRMDGCALLETEHDGEREEAWITGVEPVGITGGGGDRGVAFTDFRKAWTEVVFDIAAEANNFKKFKELCEAFLRSEQPELSKLWQDALAVVRQQNYVDPSLRKETARKASFEVVDLSQQLQAGRNQVENGPRVAA